MKDKENTSTVIEAAENSPKSAAKQPVEKQPVTKQSKPTNSVYSLKELKKAASRFNVSEECVEAAFKIKGKTEASIKEAKEIIEEFMSREVK